MKLLPALRRPYLLLLLALFLVSILLGYIWFIPSAPDNRRAEFVEHWARLFEDCSDLEAVESLRGRESPELLYVSKFANGEWIAVRMEYACGDGAGFDASVFVDSTGKICFDTSHHFCGYEALEAELGGINAANLAELYSGLSSLGVFPRNWPSCARHTANASPKPTPRATSPAKHTPTTPKTT
jgi:hypothetical protein